MKKFQHIWFSKNNEGNFVATAHERCYDFFPIGEDKPKITPEEMIGSLQEQGWNICGVTNNSKYTMYYLNREVEPQYFHIWVEIPVNNTVNNASLEALRYFTPERIKKKDIHRDEMIEHLEKDGYVMTGIDYDSVYKTFWFAKRIM